MGIKINGAVYDVGVAGLARGLRRDEKYRVTTEDGVMHREVRGVYRDFTLSLGNFGKAAYDALMAALTAVDMVTVELPDAAAVTGQYTGVFDSVTDEALTEEADGTVWWDNLALSFTGTVPLEVEA